MPSDGLILQDAGALTPSRVSELMELAIREGGEGSVAALERLVALAERVTDRQAAMEFNAAYARFREAMPITVAKTKRGEVKPRDGAPWSWWYTPIETLLGIAEPHLRANNLYVTWSEDASSGDASTVVCTLHHAAGHSRPSRVTIRRGSPNRKLSEGQQDAGTLTTAMRRALGMALGMVTSDPEDPDAAASGEPITDEHLNRIEELCSQASNPGATKEALCQWLRVGSLADLREPDFPKAEKKLLEKMRRKGER